MSDFIFSSTILFGSLGNLGLKYSLTRHNIGFVFADKIISSYTFSDFTYCSKVRGYISSGKISGRNIVFVKPDTYMNLSGKSIAAAVEAFRIDTGNVFVVHDDVDLAFGREKIKTGGSDAGHKGIRSIKAELGTEFFNRIRLGIGRSEKMPLHEHVLSNFIDDELKYINEIWSTRWKAIVEVVLEKGIPEAMNTFNRK